MEQAPKIEKGEPSDERKKMMDMIREELLRVADQLEISKDLSEWERMDEVLARFRLEKSIK